MTLADIGVLCYAAFVVIIAFKVVAAFIRSIF